MNKLVPEQSLQIVLCFQNRDSVRKAHRALSPLYGRHNRPSVQVVRITMSRFCTTHTRIDNMLLWDVILRRARMSRFVMVHSNWNYVHPLHERFCRKILVCKLTRYNSCRNYNPLPIMCVTRSVNEPKMQLLLIFIFTTKFCSTMRLMFGWMATSKSKIAAFEEKKICKALLRRRYIHTLAESLIHISWKMMSARTLQSMKKAVDPWLLTFSFPNWMALTWKMFGFNKSAQHATRCVPQSFYWRKHSCDITPFDNFLGWMTWKLPFALLPII